MNCLAKAIYDNISESPDELAFRKGDVLTVLEQNTNGLEGWWLCALRGRQGICPGNRLRLMAGMYDHHVDISSPVSFHQQQQAKRRSANLNKVITPQKVGDSYMYGTTGSINRYEQEDYDVPPSTAIPVISTPTSNFGSSPSWQADYDTPRNGLDCYSFPNKIKKSTDMNSSISSSKNDLSSEMETYDVPRSNDMFVSASNQQLDYDVPDSSHHEALNSSALSLNRSETEGCYDIPAQPMPTIQGFISGLSSGSSSKLSPCSSVSSLSLSSYAGSGSNRSSLDHHHDVYDIPPSEARRVVRKPLHVLDPIPGDIGGSLEDVYDVPSNNNPTSDALPSSVSFTATPMESVYDVPPQVSRDVAMDDINLKMKRLSTSSMDAATCDEMIDKFGVKELPLELEAAKESLVKLQQELLSSCNKLCSYVTSDWRSPKILEKRLMDIHTACVRMRTSLQDFLDFVHGALFNSTKAADKTLSHKLTKLSRPLQDCSTTVEKLFLALDQRWSVAELAVHSNYRISNRADELDQLVNCASGLIEDARQVASFIHGNATLLFKRSPSSASFAQLRQNQLVKSTSMDSAFLKANHQEIINNITGKTVQDRPLPVPPTMESKIEEFKHPDEIHEDKGWNEDYDYVKLETKETLDKENEAIKNSLPKELRKSFENLVKESQIEVDDDVNKMPLDYCDIGGMYKLDANDHKVIQFYSDQVERHLAYLTNAIDAFLLTIQNNQPPKVFVAHSKFVVLSAHKLVYIGDTVYRNVNNVDIRNKVLVDANSMCDALKHTVQCTKTAALQFPSVMAVQEMVDSVVYISLTAKELKRTICELANT